MIYRITDRQEWGQAQKTGILKPSDLEKEGFVRCCAPDQIAEIARRRYAGRHDLLLLEIDEALLQSVVRWESEDASDSFYPHVYGPIQASAVGQVSPFRT